MNHMLTRPSAAVFPAVCLLAVFLGRSDVVFSFIAAYFILEGFTLCASDAFRNAAARETGVRRVDRRFGGALIQILIGCGLFVLGTRLLLKSDGTVYLSDDIFQVSASAALIIIEQTFEERMYALGRPMDGALLTWISNLLLAAGFLLTVDKPPILPIMTGLAALIALVASIVAIPFRSFSILPRNYGFSPKAVAQTLLYPAAAATMMNFLNIDLQQALAGWILWRIARTVCRRSKDESRPMNLLLIVICGLLVLASAFVPMLDAYAIACIIALICACIVFLAPSIRLYAGVLLLLFGKAACYCLFLPAGVRLAAVYGFAVLAAALNVKNALRKKVRA